MALLQKVLDVLPLNEEKRRFQRVRVNLLGRYMLADRREFPGQVVAMSPGDLTMIAPQSGVAGERVIAYVDHVGRLEGAITNLMENGFVMQVGATDRKRDKLAAQLTWLANREILNLAEDRRHGRMVPKRPATTVVMPNGTNLSCRIIDASQSGAAIATTERPALGMLLTIGKLQGRVVRHLDDGFAIEFTRLQHPDFLEENLTGQ
jgi:hypothetical protein